MRDITDFSAKKSGSIIKNRSLFEDALKEADADILDFAHARRTSPEIPTNFNKKTGNRKDFLFEKKNVYSTKTNAVQELLENHRVEEALMYGATEEDLEQEVAGTFGVEILEVCKNHNITGTAIFDAFEILKTMLGEDPDVNAAIASWGSEPGEQEVVEDDSEDEGEEDEEIEESLQEAKRRENYKFVKEMTRNLKRKIAEEKIRNKYRR